MILPIYAYGWGVLKKVAAPINKDYEGLNKLVENMWETMYEASGVGLAAPQIGLSIRLFIIDTIQLDDKESNTKSSGLKQVFINATILEEEGAFWAYEEGCLSIPNVRGDVDRQKEIKIHYFDENFVEHTRSFSGINARVIQHEYDHIEGKLFTEKLKPLKRKLVKRKLEKIRKGLIQSEYIMKFPRV